LKIDYNKLIKELVESKNVKISCLIPAYNEAHRISPVLEIVKNYPNFCEVVVVDDGSKDSTAGEVQAFCDKYSNIRLIKLKKNGGKTEAVKIGVEECKGELIALIDADLKGLSHEYLSKMCYLVADAEYSMTILDRGGDRMSPIGWFAFFPRLMGGERAFWKKDFQKIEFDADTGYGLEFVMNLWYIKMGLKVRTVFCPKLAGAYQFKKKGLFFGLIAYARMTKEVYKKSNLRNIFLQVKEVEEDRLEMLYNLYNKTRFKTIISIVILIASILTAFGTFFILHGRYNVIGKIPNPKNNRLVKKFRGQSK